MKIDNPMEGSIMAAINVFVKLPQLDTYPDKLSSCHVFSYFPKSFMELV